MLLCYLSKADIVNWIVKWAFSPEKYMVLMLKAAHIWQKKTPLQSPMICKFKRLIRPFHGICSKERSLIKNHKSKL